MQANLFGMGRDPALFKDPEEYRPERWLRSDDDDDGMSTKSFTNLPWGHGARMCIGREFTLHDFCLFQNSTLKQPSTDLNDYQPHIAVVTSL